LGPAPPADAGVAGGGGGEVGTGAGVAAGGGVAGTGGVSAVRLPGGVVPPARAAAAAGVARCRGAGWRNNAVSACVVKM
jgi:hypothetical protein